MKLPFSYKQHVFGSILVSSFIGHVAFIGFGSFFSPSPRYAVEQAPSSMEVVIVNEREMREEKKVNEEIISLKDSPVQAHAIVKEKKKSDQAPQKKPIYIPPVKGAVSEAKPAYLKNPAPVYPNYAREQGWEGVVILKVLVGEDGAVNQIGILKGSGYKILDESALKAIQTWRFLPARVGNMSFSSWIKIPVKFILVEENR